MPDLRASLTQALGWHIAGRLVTPEQQTTTRNAFQTIATATDQNTARAWLVGLNPLLGNVSPISAIRAGRHTATLTAAEHYARRTDFTGEQHDVP
ncbi:hypothetical protein [Streptomyces hebeiensis]